jgi:hypothetical protein
VTRSASSISPLRLLLAAWVFLAMTLLGAWFAAPATAAGSPSAFAPPAFGSSEEELEEEGEPEEGEETEEELEFEVDGEGEWLEVEGNGEEETAPASILPPECLLRAARPRAIVDSDHGKLRLALAYKAWNPTELKASFKLKGPHGALRLEERTRHPSRAGTLHLRRSLGGPALRKALAAHLVVVRLDVPATPSYCHLTLRLPPTRR